jgi:general L-amino acid transport system substrate-binding protein
MTRFMRFPLCALALLVLGLLWQADALGADATNRIIASGQLRCAMVDEALDWNKTDLHGSLVPLEQEMCHAFAAALFGDASKADIQAYHSEEEALAGLRKGFSDIVVGVTPNTRAAKRFGVTFSLPIFQDGQGFMVHKDSGVHRIADMAGHKLCFIDDTDNDPIALATLARKGVRPVPFGFQEEGEMDAAIMDRHCQVVTAYLSKLAEARASFAEAKDFIILPDIIALAPVAAAADAQDSRLSGIINATISVLLQAEFLEVTQSGMAKLDHSDDPRVQRLTGEDWSTADGLGLAHDWSRHVIAATGNYAEIYNRSIGPGTPTNLPRGLNALWTQGGIMAPLPLQ